MLILAVTNVSLWFRAEKGVFTVLYGLSYCLLSSLVYLLSMVTEWGRTERERVKKRGKSKSVYFPAFQYKIDVKIGQSREEKYSNGNRVCQ